MPITNLASRQDVEASTFTAIGTDRTGVAAFRNRLLAEGSPLAVPLVALNGALASLAEQAAPLFGRLMPAALAEEIARLATRIVTPAYQRARNDIQAAKRNDAARAARVDESPASLPYASEDRAAFRALDIGGQAGWIASASRDQLASLVTAGQSRFPGLPDALWQQAVERHAIVSHVAKTGLQASYQLQPTISDPAATGPDSAAAESAAQAAMDQWRAEQRTTAEAEDVLRSTIVAVSVATDLPIDAAFKLLNGVAA